jgi:lauroyl/myristoyl acyltransferase
MQVTILLLLLLLLLLLPPQLSSPCMKRTARFSSTMPSLPAKKASTYLMKCCSLSADSQQGQQHGRTHRRSRWRRTAAK